MIRNLLLSTNFRKSLLFVFVISLPLSVSAQVLKWTNYTVGSTSTELCNNNVKTIAIDAQGSKWFGTEVGVSKFDGNTWTTYTTANGLVSNNVSSIAIDAQGNKWFGTDVGVSKFDGSNWTTYTTSNGLLSNYVKSIAIDAQGNKWFGTNVGVSKFDGSVWTSFTSANGLAINYINSIAIDKQGNIWVGTEKGVSRFNGTTWTTYNIISGLASDNVLSIAIDAHGNKWFGTAGGVSKFDGTAWTTYTTTNGLVNNSVHSVAIDVQGNKWFGTYGGVSKFDGTTWTTYTIANGLADNDVSKIVIDTQGNKWMGTYYQGVSKFDGSAWITYKINGLLSNYVSSLAIDAHGNKWFGTENGISKFNGSIWTNFLDKSNGGITTDGNDNIWVKGYKCLYKYDGNNWYTYKTIFDNDTIYGTSQIAVDLKGDKWIWFNGEKSGLARFDGVSWTTFPVPDGLVIYKFYIREIVVDLSGDKWMITDSRELFKFGDSGWKKYTRADGLPSDTVTSIAVDNQGNKWIGTNRGVYKFDGSTWTSYTSTSGSREDYIDAIAIDADGNKWLSTYGGILKFDGVNWATYPLPNNVREFDKIVIDKDGSKWFYSNYYNNGVYKFEDSGAGPASNLRNQVGAIFNDLNENGIKDSGEPLLTNQVINIDDNYYTTTLDNGYFHTSFNIGKHTIAYKKQNYTHATTSTKYLVNVNENSILDTILIGIAYNDDAFTSLMGMSARPGFTAHYWINYGSYGKDIKNGRVIFTPDHRIQISNTSPTADTVSASRLVWNFSNLKSLQSDQIIINATIPGGTSLGDTLVSSSNILIDVTDINVTNNTSILKQRVTGSIDPNDKLVTPEGVGTKKAVLMNTPLTYTIRFQNTGTDTAFNVNIVDTLNSNFDLTTLSVVASSHSVSLELKPKNEAIFHFENILLPDSNVNEPGSNGFVRYSISPKAGLPESTIITNKANIYFDFNPPVATNEVSNTFVTSLQQSQTITFNPISARTYGQAEFSLNASASSGLPVTYTSSNAAVAAVNGKVVTIAGVGTTDITASQAGNDDFAAAPNVKQSLIVGKAQLTAAAVNKSRNYGAANPTFSISYSGFVNGENAQVLSEPVISCLADEKSAAGIYSITLKGGTAANYDLKLFGGLLTINKVPIEAKADNFSRKMTEPNPPFTITYKGFVNNETEDVLDKKPKITTVANNTSSPGTYDLWLSGGKDDNYTFTYVDGRLTIYLTTDVDGITYQDFQPYPNPASDFITIKGFTEPTKVQVYDLRGKKIIDDFLKDDLLDIQKLLPGIYILRVKDQNFKLIKQ
jgi:uncharacterized repeat protein (TIGR01451 family)